MLTHFEIIAVFKVTHAGIIAVFKVTHSNQKQQTKAICCFNLPLGFILPA
jgi:hypothetical protein